MNLRNMPTWKKVMKNLLGSCNRKITDKKLRELHVHATPEALDYVRAAMSLMFLEMILDTIENATKNDANSITEDDLCQGLELLKKSYPRFFQGAWVREEILNSINQRSRHTNSVSEPPSLKVFSPSNYQSGYSSSSSSSSSDSGVKPKIRSKSSESRGSRKSKQITKRRSVRRLSRKKSVSSRKTRSRRPSRKSINSSSNKPMIMKLKSTRKYRKGSKRFKSLGASRESS